MNEVKEVFQIQLQSYTGDHIQQVLKATFVLTLQFHLHRVLQKLIHSFLFFHLMFEVKNRDVFFLLELQSAKMGPFHSYEFPFEDYVKIDFCL